MIRFSDGAFSRNRWPVGVDADPTANAAAIHRQIWSRIEAHAKRHRARWERYERAHSLRECERTELESEVPSC